MSLWNLFKPRIWMLPIATLGLAIGVVISKQKAEIVASLPVESRPLQIPEPEPARAADDLAAGIDGETMAAFYECGAQYGKIKVDAEDRFGQFVGWEHAAPTDLPAFQFKIAPAPDATLPVVGVPFAIWMFNVGRMTDTVMKRLGDQKNLTKLVVNSINVTGRGLQKLQALTHLDLAFSGLTDEGLKELSEHKTLTHLRIANGHVSADGLKEL